MKRERICHNYGFNAYLVLAAAIIFLGLQDPAEANTRANQIKPVRIITSFDNDWLFLKSDATGAEKPAFDDALWRRLDVPHDWSIEGPFAKNNPTGKGGGFLPAGIGWYRRHFKLPASDANQKVFIEFEGVMANSDVWINGAHLGKRPYGYVSFRYELTEHLNFGADKSNVIAVRVDNFGQPASRWYTGAGIYRHVRIIVTDPVHIDHWGTFVTTPYIASDRATVRVESTVVNRSGKPRNISLQVSILDTDDRTLKTASSTALRIDAGKSAALLQDVVLENPRRWDIDDPALYRVVARIREGKQILDDELVTFGIREFKFESDAGFWLNRKSFKIKGVCLHQDGSAFGAAVPLRVWERRLELLRELGVNAVRTAHNPPDPDFLNLTDRMGFLVMDEMFDVWTVAKNPFDYHLYFREWSQIDTRDTVRRDRNHPSVIIYSTGNEIRDTPKPELAKEILASLIAVFHENDPTRPVTQALFRPNVSKDYDNGLADMLDVIGQNYRENEILAAYRQKPTRKILGTENTHTREAWLALRDNPHYAGQFLWSGIDYLGESPGWPMVAFNFGLLDRTGTPRPLAFQRQSWWSDKPMVHATRRVAATPLPPSDPGYGLDRRPQVLFSDWTPRDTSPHEENVEVYSNCEEVELFLNGRSLGSKPRPADDAPRNWKVAFAPGILRAVGKNNGKAVATHELKTAGKAARVMLSVDRSSITQHWDDVSHVMATVVDDAGVIVPDASDLITFKITGPGRVVAVDSGNNMSHEPFQASERRAYQGLCVAMTKAAAGSGKITLVATAPGLTSGMVIIDAKASK